MQSNNDLHEALDLLSNPSSNEALQLGLRRHKVSPAERVSPKVGASTVSAFNEIHPCTCLQMQLSAVIALNISP